MPADIATNALAHAREFGLQALLIFAIALPSLLLAVTVLWVAARRSAWSHSPVRRSTPMQLALRLGVGFLAVVVAAWAFAELAEGIGAGAAFDAFDQALSTAVGNELPSAAARTFAWITHLGDSAMLTVLCIVVAAMLVARGRRRLALAWVIAVAGNALLNVALKGVFERVRPLRVRGLEQVSGWSFPSGHSSGSVVAYGMLAYVLIRTLPPRWHLPVVLLATTLAFSIGCSRIFLQHHYASDVAAGFASGTAWLTICIVACEWRRHRAGAGGQRIG